MLAGLVSPEVFVLSLQIAVFCVLISPSHKDSSHIELEFHVTLITSLKTLLPNRATF